MRENRFAGDEGIETEKAMGQVHGVYVEEGVKNGLCTSTALPVQ